MATHEDVRQIALALPGVTEGEGRFAFSVTVKNKEKGILWSWLERVHPRKARVVNDSVIALVVPNAQAKEAILASDPDVYFTEPHYDNYNAVLVCLEAISVEDLRPLIEEAWMCKAPPKVVAEYKNAS